VTFLAHLHGISTREFCIVLGKIVQFFTSFLYPSFVLLHGIVRYFLKPLTSYNSWHCSVQFGLLPRHWPTPFRDLLRYLCLSSCCYLDYYFFLFPSVQPHLRNVRSTSAIVCRQQTVMSFLFFKNPVKKGFFRSPIRATARPHSPPP